MINKAATEDSFEDPANDRVVKEVLPPPMFNLSHSKLFPKKGVVDYKLLKEHLIQEGKLDKGDILELIQMFKAIIKNESNIVKMADPVIVVGDIHGQFYDLIKILDKGGDPSKQKYIFLGDYVDRGAFSIECVLLLMAIKITCRTTVVMLRGNHECRQLTSFFNFKQECDVKYDLEVYDRVMEAFDSLPIACVINDKFLAVHGGLSPDVEVMNTIVSFNRFNEPPRDGPLCDFLWSDPCDKDTDAIGIDWLPNKTRGCSFIFGAKAATPFLNKNNYLTIIRGHEAQLEGYKMSKWNPKVEFPSVITVFSAPIYCDVYHNKGAFIKFVNNTINIQQYVFSPHPFILPNYMNVFSWSIPFVSEKISEIILHIIKSEPKEKGKTDTKIIDQTLTDSLKMKVQFMTMIMKMYRTLRQENELIIKLKGFCPGNKIPKGILLQGPEALKSALERYKEAKQYDQINEKMPDGYK